MNRPSETGTTSTPTACPSCGYRNRDATEATVCGMCGVLLGGGSPQGYAERADERSDDSFGSPAARGRWPGGGPDRLGGNDFGADLRGDLRGGPDDDAGPYSVGRRMRARAAWQRAQEESLAELMIVLGLGVVIAPAFGMLPFVSRMGWFFSALCHELGHTVVAWFFGMPAYPAIRLDGHAASIHQDQKMVLVLLIGAGFVALAWYVRKHLPLLVAAITAAVLYPMLAFNQPARELLHLVGGHGGELVFATVFLWRALDGGFAGSRAERVLYAALAFYMIGDHAVLCFGLMTDAGVRDWYSNNGSFGLTNDYLRVAHDVTGARLETVAAAMLLVTMLPIPAAWGLWLLEKRLRADDA